MADRHQFRANWHPYDEGLYFVTICCADKRHLFGKIVGAQFIASTLGSLVKENIEKIPSYYNDVEILNHVVMPNHIHIVISIATTPVGTRFIASAASKAPEASQPPQPFPQKLGCLRQSRHEAPKSQDFHHNSRLASVVGAFKAGVTRQARARQIPSQSGNPKIWQQRFHEYIIRSERAYTNIMNYIDNNVANWHNDTFNDKKMTARTRLIASAQSNFSALSARKEGGDRLGAVVEEAGAHGLRVGSLDGAGVER